MVKKGQVVRVKKHGLGLSDLSAAKLAMVTNHPQNYPTYDSGLVGIVYSINAIDPHYVGVWFGEHQPQVICGGYHTDLLEVVPGVNHKNDLPAHLRFV